MSLRFTLNSTLRFWFSVLLVTWLLGLLGLGWLVQSFLVLFLFLMVTPVLLFAGLQLWLRWKLVTATCPVCGFEFSSLNNTQTQCPACGEMLMVRDRQFHRLAPPGTIDVEAVEVVNPVIED
ncbi:MAG: hypothetical protein D6676_03970 [Cyanobacteria bacterium J003]|nr:MAG: hypothetical protein D6676_03970 [Cyanobacteria bacterium J003]